VFDQINGLVFGRQIGKTEELDSEQAHLLSGQTYGRRFPILVNVKVDILIQYRLLRWDGLLNWTLRKTSGLGRRLL
jgi:hypothetical protein